MNARNRQRMEAKITTAIIVAAVVAAALYVGHMDRQDEIAKKDPLIYVR